MTLFCYIYWILCKYNQIECQLLPMFRAGCYINRNSKFLTDIHSSCKSLKRKQRSLLYDASSFQLLSSPLSLSFFSSSNSENNFDDTQDVDSPKQSHTGLLQLLNDDQRQLWDDQLNLKYQAQKLVAQLPKTNSNDKQRDTLNNVVASASNSNPLTFVDGIESTFSVVVTGEFNAGEMIEFYFFSIYLHVECSDRKDFTYILIIIISSSSSQKKK